MYHNQFSLLTTRRFLPLALTQFLGAFNDNLFKNSLVILITYVLAQTAGLNAQVLVVLAGGIFILPFFLFSATAGQLADKYDKAWLIRWIKLAEIGLMLGAALGFSWGNVYFLMVLLFLMGTHSAFFGPIKFGILPDHLTADELVAGNALIEATTFLAILGGTLLGGLAILGAHGEALVSTLLLIVAIAGWLASLTIPATTPASPELRVGYNLFNETGRILNYAREQQNIFLCILGISWFWLVGSIFLSLFPSLAKDTIGANEQVVTLFLLAFSLGVAIGSLLCNRLLQGLVRTTYVPFGALGISLFGLDLYFASRGFMPATDATLIDLASFLTQPNAWRILLDLIGVALSGGLYVVPLQVLLQQRSASTHRARNIAANNVLNAIIMVAGAIASSLLLHFGFNVPEIFLVLVTVNAIMLIYISLRRLPSGKLIKTVPLMLISFGAGQLLIWMGLSLLQSLLLILGIFGGIIAVTNIRRLIPDALIKAALAKLLNLLFRVEVRGIEHVVNIRERVLIIANHLSFLDALLIAAYVPDSLTFAVHTQIAQHRFFRFFVNLAKTYPVDPTKPLALRGLVNSLRQGEKVVIFPEGRISLTGTLMKVYEGPGMVADKADAWILPVRLDGAQYSLFSRLRGKVRLRLLPRISLHFLPPRRFEIPVKLKGRARRQYASNRLYDLMTEMLFDSSDIRRTLLQSLLDAAHTHGWGHLVLEDIERKPLSYRRLIMASFVLGRRMAQVTAFGEAVGLLLPNISSAVVSFFALHAYGRVPVMLNFSAGSASIGLAARTVPLRWVYSSRRFVAMGGLAPLIHALEDAGVQVIYLEDVRSALNPIDRLFGLAAGMLPRLTYRFTCPQCDSEQAAVILFTSGTEGAPKGVVLSHRNLQANRYQVAARIDFGPTDIAFNALPLFHSFGLSTATVLPMLFGIRVFLYPSPLHYRIVPELVYETNATLLFGTDTFLAGYARFAHPYDFYSLRFACSGAEKLKEETRRIYSERFGVRIFEGYGATETGPVLAINSPMQSRVGTVGRLLPGIAWRLTPEPGIEVGGRLAVRGPNIMAGYLRLAAPGVLEPPPDGWYDTGDLATLDAAGYVTLRGRLKRFAKLGGEMISLAAVEAQVSALWPDYVHAVVALPDSKKGERLVLVTENPQANRETLIAFARQAGMAELSVPRTLICVARLPLLGSGKIDYEAVKALTSSRSS